MTIDPQRRFFLRGRVATQAPARPPRPPWALAEADFLQRCTRCGDCITACPQSILLRGDGGYPEVRFSARGCTECAACVPACTPAALWRQPDMPPWNWKPKFSDACLAQRKVECRICGEICDHGAIRFRPTLGGIAQPSLEPERCTGCGACVAPCPTQAISLKS
jgi:ferredoxin-type protein NapF